MSDLYGPLARELGGEFVPATWIRPASIRFDVQGHPAVLDTGFRMSDESATRVSVDLRGVSPGVLKIHPEGFAAAFLKLFGAQDLRVGDPRFDSLYVVKARPESLAREVFREDRRGRLVEAVRAVGRYIGFRLDLSRERLRVQVAESLSTREELRALVRLADEVVAALPLPPPLQAEAAGETGLCPVCAAALDDTVSRCRECRTPHHRECWDYSGGCSTYACGGRQLL